MIFKKERREALQLRQKEEKIFGVIHYPIDTSKKCPAVLMCHGLGGHKVGKYRLYVDLAETLASMGIIALRFDVRGSGDSEGIFSNMTIDSQVDDALQALEFLKNDPLVDVDRIGIFGRSFGGIISLLAALRYQRIKSLGLWAPLFSGQPWMEQWKSAQKMPSKGEGKLALMQVNGLYPGITLFEQLFKLNLEPQMPELHHIPLLHICGEKDQVVSLFHAEKFQAARKDARESLFLRYPESDHDFSDTAERHTALMKTVEWFQKTLT